MAGERARENFNQMDFLRGSKPHCLRRGRKSFQRTFALFLLSDIQALLFFLHEWRREVQCKRKRKENLLTHDDETGLNIGGR